MVSSRIISLLFTILAFAINASGSETVTVHGVVRDSLTREPVPYATVMLSGSGQGVLTNDKGRYSITLASASLSTDSLIASAIGYDSRTLPVSSRIKSRIDFDLHSTGLMLSGVTVRPKREYYSKRNNPAVDFMQRIRSTSHLSDPRRKDNYNYDKYERITLALNNYHFNDSARGGWDKRFPFIKEYIDSSALTGVPILNVALREKASEVHFRHDPRTERELVKGLRQSGMDEVLDAKSMQTFYEDVMREIDIYDNDITLLQNRFVSPLSRIAPDFYKFYLSDTVTVDSTRCIELTFVPRNAATMGFTGRLYIPEGDTTMFVKRVVMRVPHDINLNFINGLLVTQDYIRTPDGTRMKTRDDMIMEATVIPGSSGIYARRITEYTGHNFDPALDPSLFDRGAAQVYDNMAYRRDPSFWKENRTAAISHGEDSMESMMERLRHDKVYYWCEKIVKTFSMGYITTGNPSKFDYGPLTSSFSSNSVEGLRLRAGGMTTAALSPRWFGRGYVAHGFKDHKWKYGAEAEYSFRDKMQHSREFPVHSLRVTHLYDMDMLGQNYITNNPDNMFMSLKWADDFQMTYHRVSKLEYTLEMENNFSLMARIQNECQEKSPLIGFTDGYGRTFSHYTMNTATVELRYAPGEKFYQMRSGRLPINLDAPVFTLSHTWGPRGLAGNPFALSVTEAGFSKRFWFSAFGFTDVVLKGGHVWTRSPYPNLLLPNANLSYFIQLEAFSCLTPMEFVNDSYAQWDMTYWANGALLNYIPLIKKLKLREALFFRGLWGHLSHRNRPSDNPELFRFPAMAHTRLMTDMPYMECGVGLDNVLKFLRIDYTWRLTYRDTPGACRGGVRFMFHLTF